MLQPQLKTFKFDIYLNRVSALQIIKKWFSRFQNSNFNLDNHSALDGDHRACLGKNNPRIATKD